MKTANLKGTDDEERGGADCEEKGGANHEETGDAGHGVISLNYFCSLCYSTANFERGFSQTLL